MKITLVCIAFQKCLWRKCFPPSKGVGGGGVDKGQVQKDQQSPGFKARAADALIISNSFFWYPGDRHRIYSFSCTWHSRCGDGCQSPFGWRRGVSEGKDAGTKPNSNPLQTISSLWFLSMAPYFSQSPRPETKNHPGALSLFLPTCSYEGPAVLHLQQGCTVSFLVSSVAPAEARCCGLLSGLLPALLL